MNPEHAQTDAAHAAHAAQDAQDASEDLTAETLVEEVSIDGMCGVY